MVGMKTPQMITVPLPNDGDAESEKELPKRRLFLGFELIGRYILFGCFLDLG